MALKGNFTVEGVEAFRNKLGQKCNNVDRGVYRAAQMIRMDAQRQLKLKLSQPGTGKEYLRTKSGKVHIASVPGQPPAPDYGRLRGSARATIASDERSKLAGHLIARGKIGRRVVTIMAGGAQAWYGKRLEEKMNRPFFKVTIKENFQRWMGMWKSEVEKALRSA